MYCIVLFCFDGVVMRWDLFEIYCDVNMPIKFYWGLIFQAWGSLTSLESLTREPQLKVPPGGLVLKIFTSWKNSLISAVFEPANFGSRGKHVTPRPPGPTSSIVSI